MSSPVIALAGRPNTGKTTLFNALTGLRQRVANFAGCTVEKAVGVLEAPSGPIEVVDLPGTFSVAADSQDERVALRFLAEAAEREPGVYVLCVCEASNLQTDLSLALALKGSGYRAAVVVNMVDEAELNGLVIDAERLSRELGLPVLLASAREGRGLEEIQDFARAQPAGRSPEAADLSRADEARLRLIHETAARQAEETANRCVRAPSRRVLPTIARSIRLDRWLFHPAAGPLILALALFGVFQALFALGRPAGDWLTALFAAGSDALRPHIALPVAASLLCDGVIPGLAAVATFLPQIALLFIMIGALEQSGYLPRAGAMVDRALRPFGLDGKVFIPFLSSFACAIPGVMAARTIPNEKRRLTAILLAPLMTCSARIPVYTLIIAAFVPETFRPLGLNGQGVVMAAMYAAGVVMALLLALLLKATPLFERHPSPVTVLPPYRWPQPRELGRYVWVRCWHFIERAGKVIFTLSVALWALAAFPRAPRVSADPAVQSAYQLEHSALGGIGHAVAPVFRPIGYDWKVSIAVISSMAAREVFVGTLGTLFSLSGEEARRGGLIEALRKARGPDGLPAYNLATAVSLLLFFAFAMQCVSTIAVVRRETGGWKWPAVQFGSYLAIAYALSFAGYRIASALLLR